MLDHVREVIRRQPVIQRHQHRSDLGHGVKRLELRVCIRRDIDDTVSRLHTEVLERGGPSIAAFEELTVCQPKRAVDHRLAVSIEAPGTAPELHRA